jgi:hypothetical protein
VCVYTRLNQYSTPAIDHGDSFGRKGTKQAEWD